MIPKSCRLFGPDHATEQREGVGVLIVSCSDTPPVLEFGGQVLDFMTMAIEALVVVELRFAAFGRRNTGRDALGFERLAEPVAVIASVAIRVEAAGGVTRISRAPLGPLIWPSVSSMTSGFPAPSQTTGSLEFSPPFVRPIRRETVPFLKGWPPCDAPSDASRRS
jgi:hypothetical protein